MARGFLKELNLKESESLDKDAKAINTLAGEPIAEDLLRYVGNLRNFSKIENYTINGDTITAIGTHPFANGNYVFYKRSLVDPQLSDEVYIVFDSDVDTTFRLKNLSGVPFSRTDNSVPLYRADSVFTDNTALLRPTRIAETRTLDGIKEGIDDEVVDAWEEEQNSTLAGLINDIEFGVANFKYKKKNTLLSFDDNITNRVVRLDGSLMITNPSAIATTGTAGPGLFITDGVATLRAFSDNSNPWDPEPGITPTGALANTISIKPGLTASAVEELVLTNPKITMSATDISSASGIVNDTIANGGWSHKVEVSVNGTTYYLLLNQ